MSNSIHDLNEAVKTFYEQCKNDQKAKNAVEVVTISFGGNVQVESDFGPVDKVQIPHLSASGGTPMGTAMTTALDKLDARKKEYKDNGIDYYQPMLVLMSDGGATDQTQSSANRAADMVKNKKLTVLPLAFGTGADTNTLESFAHDQKSIYIGGGFSFIEFFRWLSQSASAMASGQSVDLNVFTPNP
ncbi:MAG: VWA domain-containing protein [Ignavibacteriales bacterium]|nr:VWA domain-containing protein [Ignavibacteriales bacterium]